MKVKIDQLKMRVGGAIFQIAEGVWAHRYCVEVNLTGRKWMPYGTTEGGIWKCETLEQAEAKIAELKTTATGREEDKS